MIDDCLIVFYLAFRSTSPERRVHNIHRPPTELCEAFVDFAKYTQPILGFSNWDIIRTSVQIGIGEVRIVRSTNKVINREEPRAI